MSPYDFVHMALLAMDGKISGRTKLQKTVYFLGAMTRKLPDLGYRPHFYGPYSQQVSDAVGRLKALRFLDETIAGMGLIDRRGFEVARYDYRLSDRGKRMAKKKTRKFPAVWGKMRSAASTLKKAGDVDYVKLSIAAKTFFMLGERSGETTPAKISKVASRFGWSVKPGQVKEAGVFLRDLGLVRLT